MHGYVTQRRGRFYAVIYEGPRLAATLLDSRISGLGGQQTVRHDDGVAE